MEKESIAAEVEPDIKKQLRVAAAQEGISMSAYIRRAVKNQLEEDQSGNEVRQTATIS
jgi:predicted HicB family RNase H-like nuclease